MNIKTSFEYISNQDAEILILGSLPGDTSLAINEYYGHPQNRFWKIISTITNSKLPKTYSEKIELLLTNKIALWDVVKTADRQGSLDTAIKNVNTNPIDKFIEQHKNLRIIGFNGKKAELLFDKHFTRVENLNYISLPSTSPANRSISEEIILKMWQNLKAK